eukprot:CAMPEP_0203858462 /NCGR_PEP_ID=MMETSP0359-20131031/11282_1 /ASSEMBLY_ACC=CAM_ASM_000338 /TAXON_ID=268821 /ORGANISM="Scrippsiella Hangoei, Strain SHTV-5" /LENGTH=114 /DNA_ID=CAMNT_0050775241 /DNA_START=173 /DNA_END=516 /DNA_ORIENTATION=+
MSAHGMSVLLRRARARHQGSARSITTGGLARALRSPTRTLCTKARGLSSQHLLEQAPHVRAAEAVLPLPPEAKAPLPFTISRSNYAKSLRNSSSNASKSQVEAFKKAAPSTTPS